VATDAARRRAAVRAAIVFLVVIALDQLSKHTLGTWIKPGQVRHVVPGLTFVYERNTGVAFSFLAGTGALVYVVTIAALGCLVTFMLMRPTRRLLWLPTGMLVGGAVGNLIDRIARGSVIDFIKLPHWPAFNVADMAITFGVIILVLVIEQKPRSGDGS
jgi:signal peptidase II